LKIVWTDRATLNRDAQLDYIGQDNPAAAIHVDDEIDSQVMQLSDFPRIGRPGKRAGTRELVIDRTPYIAVYRIDGDTVRILRLLHGAQRFP
jgi:toxin ParE1/3/4